MMNIQHPGGAHVFSRDHNHPSRNRPEPFVDRQLRHPAVDPLRKIRFRESARDIVAKDRRDRKNGFTVDTSGSIARALERAYRQGFIDAQILRSNTPDSASVPGAPIRWAMLPPRPRHAFWSICLLTYGPKAKEERLGYLAPEVTDKGTPGWKLIFPDWKIHEKVIGQKTITPLVNLGLLERSTADANRLVVSKLGVETWRLFCKQGGQFPEDLRDV